MEIINAEGQVLGRLASRVAKLLVVGTEVSVVNSEKSIVSGDRKVTFKRFSERLERGDPLHGPFYPRQPQAIFRRAVVGMLPKTARGKEALRRLKVFRGNPTGKEGKVLAKTSKELRARYVTLEEISSNIGG